ncbi:MAG: hypothetical protein AB1714_22250 [Acidobacteriota bacterium]
MRITLIQMIAFCFEKDEAFGGWGLRYCPFRTEREARRVFDAWQEELSRWKGPGRLSVAGSVRRARWRGVRMKQSGRGIGMWIRRGSIDKWWGDGNETWVGDPCERVLSW